MTPSLPCSPAGGRGGHGRTLDAPRNACTRVGIQERRSIETATREVACAHSDVPVSFPRWEQRLRLALDLFALARVGADLIPAGDRVELARRGVVAAIDEATAQGVPERDVDAALARIADEEPA